MFRVVVETRKDSMESSSASSRTSSSCHFSSYVGVQVFRCPECPSRQRRSRGAKTKLFQLSSTTAPPR